MFCLLVGGLAAAVGQVSFVRSRFFGLCLVACSKPAELRQTPGKDTSDQGGKKKNEGMHVSDQGQSSQRWLSEISR